MVNGNPAQISVSASDDNALASVVCSDGNQSITLSLSQGTSYTGELPTLSYGSQSVTCTASDADNLSASSTASFDVLPNDDDVVDAARAFCGSGDFTEGASQNALSTIGSCKNALDETIGFTRGASPSSFNGAPTTLVGQNNPQYVIGISEQDINVNGVNIPAAGDVFAAEVLTQSELDAVASQTTFTAINVVIDDNMSTGLVSYTINGDVELKGKTAQVACCDFDLTLSSSGLHQLSEQTLSAGTFDEGSTTLTCTQTVAGASGTDVSSTLYGTVVVEKRVTPNSAPSISDTVNVEFDQFLADGMTPRDSSSYRVSAVSVSDESGLASVSVSINTVSGMIAPQTLMDEGNGVYTLSTLRDYGDEQVYVSITAIDIFNSESSFESSAVLIDKNDLPACVQNTIPEYTQGEGMVDVADSVNCTDAEGDVISMTPNQIDITEQTATGTYNTTVAVNDALGLARGTDDVSIAVQYTVIEKENSAPTIDDVGSFDGSTSSYNTFYDPVTVNLTTPTCADIDLDDTLTVNVYKNGELVDTVLPPGSIYSVTHPRDTVIYDSFSAECTDGKAQSRRVSKNLEIFSSFN